MPSSKRGGGSKASSRKMETPRPREGHGLLEVSYFRPRSRPANYEAEARPDKLSSHWHLHPDEGTANPAARPGVGNYGPPPLFF